MRKAFFLPVILLLLGAALFAACGSADGGAAQVVEAYYRALAAKDADQVVALSCADWEPSALMEVDSLQSVETRLDNLACKVTGSEGEYTLVSCQGKISMSYNGEAQTLDLSAQTYKVVEQGGAWLFCGYR